MNNHELRLRNDLAALRFIHHFSWLRAAELGTLMKPHTATAPEAGARLARSLVKRRLVLARKLPEGAGHALLLATAGVRLLSEYGIPATSGKSIGYTSGACWTPPSTWKHDLLAHGVLCELFKRGYEVLPEAEIRRRSSNMAKLPDGLVRAPGNQGQWHWLEVEHARKSGQHMHHLAAAIAAVSLGQVELCGVRPTRCIVAYFATTIDERGHQLDHRTRVSKAVATTAPHDIAITFAECARKGAAGVGEVQLITTAVVADLTSAILKRLNANGWHHDANNGVMQAHYGRYTAFIWQDDDVEDRWSYQIEQDGNPTPAGYAEKISDAKRCAAALISVANAIGR